MWKKLKNWWLKNSVRDPYPDGFYLYPREGGLHEGSHYSYLVGTEAYGSRGSWTMVRTVSGEWKAVFGPMRREIQEQVLTDEPFIFAQLAELSRGSSSVIRIDRDLIDRASFHLLDLQEAGVL